MRKKLMTLLLVALTCLSASAQVRFGVKGGLDLANFWGKETSHGMLPSYQGGLLLEYKFHPHFGIAPEVVFAAQGGKGDKVTQYNKYGSLEAIELTHHTNYINVPVMLKYYPTQDFSVDFGPQVGFNVYSKSTGSSGKAVDEKSQTHAVDFALGLGSTYDLDNNVFIQFRYTLGLTHVFKPSTGCVIITDYRKNSNIQLALGVKF